jgi:glycosyltransferase involved in cell wall biosynthesis
MGRPVLTTNAVGCKETVEEGINGFKVPVKSLEVLAKKMIWFIENSDQIEKMGRASRKMAEDEFDVHKVNQEMLKIMGIK